MHNHVNPGEVPGVRGVSRTTAHRPWDNGPGALAAGVVAGGDDARRVAAVTLAADHPTKVLIGEVGETAKGLTAEVELLGRPGIALVVHGAPVEQISSQVWRKDAGMKSRRTTG